MSPRLTLNWHEHHSSLVSLLQTFWGNNLLVDCTLAAEGKYLKAHRVILSACSPYFQLLFSQENDKNPIVILKDVQFECLKSVIDFVYSGEVQVRESQLSTFLEVARSLQIKGLDSNEKEAQKSGCSTRSKKKGSSSQSMECGASDEVIDVNNGYKVVRVVNRISKASSSEQCPSPSPSQAEDARSITIESAYSIATSGRSTPEKDVTSNSEALEHPGNSAHSSVASRVPDSAGAVQSSIVPKTNNLKCDPDENPLARENTSNESASRTGNNRRQSSDIYTSGTEEGANNGGVTPDPSDDDNSSRRRRKCNSTVPAKRGLLRRSQPALKSPRLQLSRREVAALPGSVTPSVKTKKATQRSSMEAVEPSMEAVEPSKPAVEPSKETVESSKEAVESLKEAESAISKPKNSGDGLSKVLTIVLSKAKIPASAFVPKKELPKGTLPPITYSGPNAKRQRRYLKRHTCPDCNRQFLRPSYLVVHRRKHTGEKPHICPICNKCFAQPGALKRHARLHTGERPYTCKHCHKSFNRSSTLKVHERLHTGERPFKCPDCGKTFVGHSQLWSHKRVHMEGNYKCDACGEAFKRKPLLIQHWFLVHEKGEVIHTVL